MQAAVIGLSITGAACFYRAQTRALESTFVLTFFRRPTNAWGNLAAAGIMTVFVKPAILAISLASSAAVGVFLRSLLEKFALRQNLLEHAGFSHWEFGIDTAISLSAGTVAAIVEKYYIDNVSMEQHVSVKEQPKMWLRMTLAGWIVAVAVGLGLNQFRGK